MADLAELERVLAAEWNRDNLAVYGDYLQSIGDPRGELIAIDLAGGDPARKHALLEQWLGLEMAVRVRECGDIANGFLALRVTPANAGRAQMVLDGPAGAFLATLELRGCDDEHARVVFATVGSAPRRWLRELHLDSCQYVVGAGLLRRVPWRKQLERARLPPLRGDADLDALEAALAGMPRAAVEIARTYGGYVPARALPPRVQLLPERTLPDANAFASSDRLDMWLDGAHLSYPPIWMPEVVTVVERGYAALPEWARATWREFLAIAARLEPRGRLESPDDGEFGEFPAERLGRALDVLELADHDHPELAELRRVLHRRRGQLAVQIARR